MTKETLRGRPLFLRQKELKNPSDVRHHDVQRTAVTLPYRVAAQGLKVKPIGEGYRIQKPASLCSSPRCSVNFYASQNRARPHTRLVGPGLFRILDMDFRERPY